MMVHAVAGRAPDAIKPARPTNCRRIGGQHVGERHTRTGSFRPPGRERRPGRGRGCRQHRTAARFPALERSSTGSRDAERVPGVVRIRSTSCAGIRTV